MSPSAVDHMPLDHLSLLIVNNSPLPRKSLLSSPQLTALALESSIPASGSLR